MKEPKIRFKGFQGEWEETSLGKLSTNYKYGINAAAIPYDGTNKYLRITDIDENTRMFSQEDLTSPGTDLSCCNEYLLEEGDITIARTGASVGKSYIYHLSDGKVYFAGFLIRTRLNENVDKDYVFYSTLTDKYAKYIRLVSQRSGQPGVNVEELKGYTFNLPCDKAEQQSIASYFQHLDTHIQSTTKKIESLKQVKAASLQSMFPQEGGTTPRVRFKEFEGEWEKVQFSKLYEPSSIKNKTFGADKIISVANMYFKPVSYISDEEYLKSYNVMNLGDIAFEGNKSKNYAHGRFVENTIGDGIVSHVFIVLKPISKQYDLQFWKYLINYERIMGPILLRSTKHSTMMTDLVVSDFLKESVLVPSYEEQIEIGKILSSLDRQITLHTQRLEKLKQIKTACLDNMFV